MVDSLFTSIAKEGKNSSFPNSNDEEREEKPPSYKFYAGGPPGFSYKQREFYAGREKERELIT